MSEGFNLNSLLDSLKMVGLPKFFKNCRFWQAAVQNEYRKAYVQNLRWTDPYAMLFLNPLALTGYPALEMRPLD